MRRLGYGLSGGRVRAPTRRRFKPRLHRNANRMRTRTRHSKMMRTFDVDVLPRRGKQHLAVRRTFGEQPNAIRRLSVHQREGEANSIRLCDEHSANSRMLSVECRYIKGNSRTMRLCRVDSLPRSPNSTRRLSVNQRESTYNAFM